MPKDSDSALGRPRPAPARTDTRELVRRLLEAGLSRAEAARQLGISKPTVTYHARRLGYPITPGPAYRYYWAEVQRYYDAGHSIRKCIEHYGFSGKTFHDAVKRGAIVTRPAATPIEELLVAGRRRNRTYVKLRLLRAGLKQNRCEDCGLTEWRGRRLSIALHHVNGDGHDNRPENIKFLCPNCHSQTDNFAGRNRRRSRPAVAGLPPGAIPASSLRWVRLPVLGEAA